jgi:hypothetical protein
MSANNTASERRERRNKERRQKHSGLYNETVLADGSIHRERIIPKNMSKVFNKMNISSVKTQTFNPIPNDECDDRYIEEERLDRAYKNVEAKEHYDNIPKTACVTSISQVVESKSELLTDKRFKRKKGESEKTWFKRIKDLYGVDLSYSGDMSDSFTKGRKHDFNYGVSDDYSGMKRKLHDKEVERDNSAVHNIHQKAMNGLKRKTKDKKATLNEAFDNNEVYDEFMQTASKQSGSGFRAAVDHAQNDSTLLSAIGGNYRTTKQKRMTAEEKYEAALAAAELEEEGVVRAKVSATDVSPHDLFDDELIIDDKIFLNSGGSNTVINDSMVNSMDCVASTDVAHNTVKDNNETEQATKVYSKWNMYNGVGQSDIKQTNAPVSAFHGKADSGNDPVIKPKKRKTDSGINKRARRTRK